MDVRGTARRWIRGSRRDTTGGRGTMGHQSVPPRDTKRGGIDTGYDDENRRHGRLRGPDGGGVPSGGGGISAPTGDGFRPENDICNHDYKKRDTPAVDALRVEPNDFNAEHAIETGRWRNNSAKTNNYTPSADRYDGVRAGQ